MWRFAEPTSWSGPKGGGTWLRGGFGGWPATTRSPHLALATLPPEQAQRKGRVCPGTNPSHVPASGDLGKIVSMSSTERPNVLSEFLQTRRMDLQPELVGLPAPSDPRRRAKGLRREEVAALASISPDYYARIEQGRRSAPWPTLDAIARVLRLDDAGREYLYELSAKDAARAARPERTGPERESARTVLRPGLRRGGERRGCRAPSGTHRGARRRRLAWCSSGSGEPG